MALRFPLEYQTNCPMVLLTPYKYIFPYGDEKTSVVKLQSGYPGIDSVALYLPGAFKEGMGSSWEPQNILGGTGDDLGSKVANEFINLAKTSMGGKITSTISAGNGVIAMPMDLLVYGGPTPIELNFSFQMVAISGKENAIVNSIAQNFKKASTPTKGTYGDFQGLVYPPIWDIDFEGVKGMGYAEKKKYEWMALTGCNISYPGESNMYIYPDGMPVQVTLDLTFKCVKKFMD